MSGLKMVTLKDGYRIQVDALAQITNKLEDVFKEHRRINEKPFRTELEKLQNEIALRRRTS